MVINNLLFNNTSLKTIRKIPYSLTGRHRLIFSFLFLFLLARRWRHRWCLALRWSLQDTRQLFLLLAGIREIFLGGNFIGRIFFRRFPIFPMFLEGYCFSKELHLLFRTSSETCKLLQESIASSIKVPFSDHLPRTFLLTCVLNE